MSERVNVRMSKIMPTPIKIGVHTYATYVNCRTIDWFLYDENVGNEWVQSSFSQPASIHLFKDNNRNTRKRYKYVQSLQ